MGNLKMSLEQRLEVARDAMESAEKKVGRPTIFPGRTLTRAEKQARYFEKYPDRKRQSLERLRKLREKKIEAETKQKENENVQ